MVSLLTVKDVGERLKLSKAAIYCLMKSGKFPTGIKIGSARRWPEEQLDEFIITQWR